MKSISFLVNTFGESQVNFSATLESYSNPATGSSPKFKTELINEEAFYIFEISLIRFENFVQKSSLFTRRPIWRV